MSNRSRSCGVSCAQPSGCIDTRECRRNGEVTYFVVFVCVRLILTVAPADHINLFDPAERGQRRRVDRDVPIAPPSNSVLFAFSNVVLILF